MVSLSNNSVDNKDLPKTIEDSDMIQQNVKKQKKLKKNNLKKYVV